MDTWHTPQATVSEEEEEEEEEEGSFDLWQQQESKHQFKQISSKIRV